jgi:hypothetical protein
MASGAKGGKFVACCGVIEAVYGRCRHCTSFAAQEQRDKAPANTLNVELSCQARIDCYDPVYHFLLPKWKAPMPYELRSKIGLTMRQNTPFDPTRAIAIAICAGAVVAIGMMFVPMPLADEGRAFVAFVTGAITLCGLTIALLRTTESGKGLDQLPAARRNSAAQLNTYVPRYLSAKMGRAQIDEVTGASTDLGDIQSKGVADLPDQGSGDQTLELVEVAPDSLVTPSGSSTANMVAQLETAVAHRHLELAQLAENLFNPPAGMSDHSSDERRLADMDESQSDNASESRRPVLELMPSASMQDDDVDSALAAALATLHRMNSAAR